MSPQKYERVSVNDQEDAPDSPQTCRDTETSPSSPPPSFRSRASSPSSRHFPTSEDPLASEAERTLADTFDDGSDSDDGLNDEGDDRQRLMRTSTVRSNTEQRVVHDGDRPDLPGVIALPGANPPVPSRISVHHTGAPPISSLSQSNDGVFANLNAKPERGEKLEEQPPSYEAAAADATPPYWETTILAPGHLNSSDEVYVDGLPVGSLFSFVWNGMISMSFQLVGFLLTYLLHTTHAAKNGSRAGLGITLVQYGFYMRSNLHKSTSPEPATNPNDPALMPPPDPTSHDFDPSKISSSAAAAANAAMSQAAASQASSTPANSSSGLRSDWFAYALMIVGWFILIRALSDFIKARRHEQLVLQSPDRGLNVPIVADTEAPETVV